MAAFDMTGITLLHGWLLDPQDRQTAAVVQGISYNKLVEMLMDHRSAASKMDEECAVEGDTGAPSKEEEPVYSKGECETRTDFNSSSGETGVEVGNLVQEAVSESMLCSAANFADQGSSPLPETLGGQTTAEDGNEGCSSSDAEILPLVGNQSKVNAVEIRAEGNGVECCADTVAAQTETAPTTTSLEGRGSASTQKNGCLTDIGSMDGLIVETFYRETASQLTYYGLLQLHQTVRERQLCVFFRNNHFSSLFKYEGKLYLLVTDLGYAREYSVVWEKLDQIDGDTEYVDNSFMRISSATLSPALKLHHNHDDQDYILALTLQQGATTPSAERIDFQSTGNTSSPTSCSASAPGQGEMGSEGTNRPLIGDDEAVAFALQREEEDLFRRSQAAYLCYCEVVDWKDSGINHSFGVF
ncbi:unnamed protein product [Choristocarpus tenellus]